MKISKADLSTQLTFSTIVVAQQFLVLYAWHALRQNLAPISFRAGKNQMNIESRCGDIVHTQATGIR